MPEIIKMEMNMQDIKNLLEKRQITTDIRDIFAAETEKIAPQESVGRISADIIFACPPGYPILIYGEKVTEEHLPFLIDKPLIEVVKE